ncbi:MAG: transketolase [Nanoarchaeales archaeon]|nr:transketolase [Nanoarchaeales archaeon]
MKIKEIKLLANTIRMDIIKMLNLAKSGHTAGPLGMTDLFTVLYGEFLKFNPKKPLDKKRDFVFLSNGHTCPVLYSTLARFNYFPVSELKTLRKLGSRLQGHPHLGALPGVENSGGPLAQGISQAVGLAASLKRDKKDNKVFCFTGDGELDEGQCWEAFLFAAKEKLDNLTIIVDRNDIQIDGTTEDVLPLGDLNKKFTSFNFAVIEFDANNIEQIRQAYKEANKIKHKPVCLIAKTIPGKGVSFMEKDFHWHGVAPSDQDTKLALEELKILETKINGGKI